ncbi:hypothetical protein O181_021773 [Austropuccinia psidii MF-1]|uniref:Uncharacterized protein n=1 Tax=Austropuccinia psidii MF-1 TaxID=1389203 RepID=A0A9Q3CDZ1_9BASI|nr:hypothetical protein [Austropuccinia psidii MF-1]
MRESFVGVFTIVRLIGKNAVEIRLTEDFSRKHPVFSVNLVKPYHQTDDEKSLKRKKIVTHEKLVEEDYSPGAVKKIIKSRKIRNKGKEKGHYLVILKNQPEDKYKWLSEKEIPH